MHVQMAVCLTTGFLLKWLIQAESQNVKAERCYQNNKEARVS